MVYLSRHGVPQYWTRDDARGTWDRTEAWPPAVPAALPAAKPPLAPASDSCSGEADNIDEDMLLEVRHAPVCTFIQAMCFCRHACLSRRVIKDKTRGSLC